VNTVKGKTGVATPKRGGGIECVLLANQQWIADFKSLGELQDLVAVIDGDADHAHTVAGPFGMQGFEQWNFAAAGRAPGGPEVDDQDLPARR